MPEKKNPPDVIVPDFPKGAALSQAVPTPEGKMSIAQAFIDSGLVTPDAVLVFCLVCGTPMTGNRCDVDGHQLEDT